MCIRDSASSGQLLLLSGVFGLLVGAFCFVLARPMIRLFYGAIDADVLDASVLYLRVIAISYPFLALYNGCLLYTSVAGDGLGIAVLEHDGQIGEGGAGDAGALCTQGHHLL